MVIVFVVAALIVLIAMFVVMIFIGCMSDEELEEAGVVPTWRHR